MAEVIDITKYRKKKEEQELDDLSQRLADLIADLGIETEFQSFVESPDHIYGMPFVYTMFPHYSENNSVETLSDVTDVLTTMTLKLDELGHTKWANDISRIVGEIFVSGSSRF